MSDYQVKKYTHDVNQDYLMYRIQETKLWIVHFLINWSVEVKIEDIAF